MGPIALLSSELFVTKEENIIINATNTINKLLIIPDTMSMLCK